MAAHNGPGKYDPEATLVRERTGAIGVVLIVVGGQHGNAFTVQGPLHFLRALPDMLERIAADIRREHQEGSR